MTVKYSSSVMPRRKAGTGLGDPPHRRLVRGPALFGDLQPAIGHLAYPTTRAEIMDDGVDDMFASNARDKSRALIAAAPISAAL